jgi:hypothetical protein
VRESVRDLIRRPGPEFRSYWTEKVIEMFALSDDEVTRYRVAILIEDELENRGF